MKVLILGSNGFIGSYIVQKLLDVKELIINGHIESISSIDLFDNQLPQQQIESPLIEYFEGDISDEKDLETVINQKPDLIFHLAAIVSGEAEKDFDLGMQVNLYANLKLLELLRSTHHCPLIVFASTCAVFGGDLQQTVYDHTAPSPQSSYGTQKAMIELLLSDYTRRGWIDARILRLPTIAIRSYPNQATSTFVSSIIREPLKGNRTNCPVSPDVKVWILSPRKVTDHFVHAASLSEDQLGNNRVINLPGITLSVRELIDALETVSGMNLGDLIDWNPDLFIQSIVLSWPPIFQTDRAKELGFEPDKSAVEIIRSYIEDELGE